MVAVAVFEIPEVGRRHDEYSALPANDACRTRQFIGKQITQFIFAVVVGVHQFSHLPLRLCSIRIRMRIGRHLGSIHSSVFVVSDRHRVAEPGFVRDQLHATALLNGKGLRGIRRAYWFYSLDRGGLFVPGGRGHFGMHGYRTDEKQCSQNWNDAIAWVTPGTCSHGSLRLQRKVIGSTCPASGGRRI